MKKLVGIFEGEKISLEKYQSRDGKVQNSLYILCGHDSIKIGIRDKKLYESIDVIPPRTNLRIKAMVQTFKDEIYLRAISVEGI